MEIQGQNSAYATCKPKGQPGSKKCILSFDGGGVRGIMSCVMIEYLESKLQSLEGSEDVRIADYFDEIAGTSTGALVACLLVAPDPVTKRPRFSAKDCTNFYLQHSAQVFPQDSGLFSSVKSWITRLKGPKYSPAGLESILKEVFGDLKLTETFKPVIVPSYDINYECSVLFSTTQAKSKQIPDCYIRDVCRATTAAPTYFPPHYFTSTTEGGEKWEFNMVDGGVSANNPAFIAVSELLKDHVDEAEKEIKYEDLLVISFGTGQKNASYSATTCAKWGILSWIYNDGSVPLLDMLTLASQDIVDYNMSSTFYEQCCHDNYLRVQIEKLEENQTSLDDSSESNLQALMGTAQNFLRSKAQTRNKLGQFVPDSRWTTYDAALSQCALNYALLSEKS
ncbi:hypothetical protein M758_7G162200 [Ceratodon purpureus]|uniref:Patatin n=1 Tax=Ceratodon purpureus TaxID=3225 RepID=A0A8T0HDU0_CERPU|nr:hypothetical protein KC19_7G118400 [Ceratodon purpureus]KAG0567203.1 hypothetical protein KC19_7G118400 [Ceratodon purpureus]KAG0567206.1 hypothetical protein KC19_7G118400 [Ceratodon purpureus]KAG0611748.1 hypothetical protein M758_7G162200 [Ceratodon purpureus]